MHLVLLLNDQYEKKKPQTNVFHLMCYQPKINGAIHLHWWCYINLRLSAHWNQLRVPLTSGGKKASTWKEASLDWSLQHTTTQIALNSLPEELWLKQMGLVNFPLQSVVFFNEILWGSPPLTELVKEEGGGGVRANDIRYISTGKQRHHAY